MPNDHYDIVIVGAGLVGASLALALQNLSLKISVIEAVPLPPCGGGLGRGEDGRSLALTYGSARTLEKIGIWSELVSYTTPINTVHVSQRGHFGMTRIHARDEGVPALGYIIPAQTLGGLLQQKLLATQQIKLFNPNKVQALNKTKNGWNIELCSNKTITANLIIAADGAQSTLRKLLDIKTTEHDYQQSAIATTVNLIRDHQNIAYERFIEDGAIALLPRSELCSALIWTGATTKITELMSLSDNEFLSQVQEQFGYRLGKLQQVNKRFIYPLKMLSAEEQVREGFVLLGNAAHTIHPIAAQGFNLGLGDVAVLSKVIVSALQANKNISDMAVLQEYLDRRIAAQKTITRFTDSLTSLFNRDFLPLNLARTAGFLVLDFVPALKHKLARQLMGVEYV